VAKKYQNFALWGLFIALLLLIDAITQWPDQNLHLIACDVGQGDGIIITHRFTQVVIDGGPNSNITNCLSNHTPFWDRTIELVILTHPDYDHYRGLIDLVEGYQVSQIIANNISKDNSSFWQLHRLIINRQIPVYAPSRGDKINAGQLKFTVLHPSSEIGDIALWQNNPITIDQGSSSSSLSAVLGAYSGDANEASISLLLDFGDVEALLTGDIGSRSEQALVGEGLITDVEILKVAHHGSKFSTSSEFLGASLPDIALISVGAKNTYGHPTRDTLNRLDTVGAKILRTDLLGTIHLITDGQQIWQKP